MSEQQSGSAVEQAERVLADLERKRSAHIQKGVELQDERAALGYDVHAANNQKARKRLDELHRESAEHSSELASIDAALRVAGENLAAARAAEGRAKDRDNAVLLREAVQEFAACGESLAEALAAIIEECAALREALNRIHILGVSHPRDEIVNALLTNAILTSLGQTPFKREFRTLAPRERRNAAVLVREWAARIEANDIAPRLGEQTKEEAAA